MVGWSISILHPWAVQLSSCVVVLLCKGRKEGRKEGRKMAGRCTTLVKKLWNWLLWVWRSTSSSSSRRCRSNSKQHYSGGGVPTPNAPNPNPTIGEFDRIPWDLLLQILKLLGPKEAARTAVLCRPWKIMVSDNQLWLYFLRNTNNCHGESAVFAENHLRSGYPLRYVYEQFSDLSLMRVYAQRAQLSGAVIIDGGSGYSKFGWSKYASPSGRSSTFLEFGNIDSPTYSRLRNFFATIFTRLNNQDIQLLFPSPSATMMATLALFAARRTSGIVVNIGFHVTSVVPVFQGKVMRDVGVEVVGQGALKLTGFLKELMLQRNINFESLYTVRTLKENLCYVAADYEAEMTKDTQSSFEVPGEGWFTLSKERFQTGEILFKPRMGGMRAMGLHQAVALCMDHCQDSEVSCDDSWFKTVVLAGGSACLPGLPERLEKELFALLSPSMSKGLRVIPPPYGAESAWFGGKVLSNTSTFLESWCMTKNQFKRRTRRSFINAW
ncbi:hypothetical protein Sjap_003941 [Stephania japonica]|uniref:F-box domain-containing protein n=1 Tax=Stephania japonica TaxID=461633 RepID=A0AAP0PXN8_9MAGN